MKILFFLLFLTLSAIEPGEALSRLVQGNQRYVEDLLQHPYRSRERREALLSKQKPFAIIVACSDSRVSPEILFDQGIGDLFVIRVAGNVIGSLEEESIRYAALYLGSSIILVMGHQNCGAIDAVIHGKTKDIPSIATIIEPSVRRAKKIGKKNLLYRATIANATNMKETLLKNPLIAKLVAEKKIRVEASYYNFQTGAVELL